VLKGIFSLLSLNPMNLQEYITPLAKFLDFEEDIG
jgi:hypothetical protein